MHRKCFAEYIALGIEIRKARVGVTRAFFVGVVGAASWKLDAGRQEPDNSR